MADVKPIAPKIGIIYPPPEVRNIVDKTASFVARNGPDFESRIRQNEINNPKFNFLNPNDPYHAYYQHKVKDFTEGKALEPTVPKSVSTTSKLNQETPKAIAESFIPKDPPKDFEYIYEAPSITAQDIDIVKLTAQFVARNGRQFLTQLMNREQRNYQFDFLRSQHSMFGYFTKLVEQYAKILLPPKDLVKNLKDELEDQDSFMESLRYRVEWFRHEERIRKCQEEAAERERVAYAMIDWHDFVVVETVDFQPNEIGNFPLPTTPEEVGGRVIARERGDPEQQQQAKEKPVPVPIPPPIIPDENDGFSDSEDNVPVKKTLRDTVFSKTEDDMELSDEEKDNGKSSEKKMHPPTQVPSMPNPSNVIIRDYNPKVSQKFGSEKEVVHLISPLTGEKIPANQAPKHVKVGLLDPKWIEQKDKEIRMRSGAEEIYASGSQVSSNLRSLAEKRSDIFSVDTQENKMGYKDNKPAIIEWDGHAGSADAVMRRAQASVTQEQLQAFQDEEMRLEAERSKIGVALPSMEPEVKKPREQ